MGQVILDELERRLVSTLEVVKKDLGGVRTGRAKTSLVEEVKVEAYGTLMHLRELATITAPDPSLIVIAPWDKGLVGAVVSGIQKAGLNLQPIVDGEVIKIAIPPLSQERREELVKLVQQKIESGKIMVRNVRAEIKANIEAQEGEAGVSEDNIKNWLEQMQKQVDKSIEMLETLKQEKEKELLTL